MARKESVTRVIDGDTFMTDSKKNPVMVSNNSVNAEKEPFNRH